VQTRARLRGQILKAVNGQVCVTGQHGFLNSLGEQTDAARRPDRPQVFVPLARHQNQFRGAAGLLETCSYPPRLPDGKRASTRGNPEKIGADGHPRPVVANGCSAVTVTRRLLPIRKQAKEIKGPAAAMPYTTTFGKREPRGEGGHPGSGPQQAAVHVLRSSGPAAAPAAAEEQRGTSALSIGKLLRIPRS